MHICFRQTVSIQKLMASRGIDIQISLPTVSLLILFPVEETLKGPITIEKIEGCACSQAAPLKPWVRAKWLLH